MKILVTGSYGQLGSELKEISGTFSEWDFLFTDIDSLDITDHEQVRNFCKAENPGFIINCAAYTAVDKAEDDYENARKVNAMAPSFLAGAAREINAGFITISTDYVYSGESCRPYSEDDETGPATVYGKTKLEGEQLSLMKNPGSVIIRTSWLYSCYGENFVKKMLELARTKNSLKVVFDQAGTPTYASDLARAILSIVRLYDEKSENYIPGIYNYSNEGVASWYDFAWTVFDIPGIECKLIPALTGEFPAVAKRPSYSVLNKQKIKSTFGIDIPYWKESLKICLGKITKR
jgi:dTDP-4-dehydrorhamnose reductase